MKRELQVGDRVAVYNCEGRWFGTVGSVLPADLYEIQPATSATQGWYIAHRKQLRRLIRRERRRVWIWKEYFRGVACEAREAFRETPPEPGDTFIEFLEARPRNAGRG